MGIAIGSEKVGGLAIGDEKVGGLALGSVVIWRVPLTAPVITSQRASHGRIGLTIREALGADGYLIEIATVVDGERGSFAPVTDGDGLTFTETPERGSDGVPTGKTLRSYEWPVDAGTYDVRIRAMREGEGWEYERGPATWTRFTVRAVR